MAESWGLAVKLSGVEPQEEDVDLSQSLEPLKPLEASEEEDVDVSQILEPLKPSEASAPPHLALQDTLAKASRPSRIPRNIRQNHGRSHWDPSIPLPPPGRPLPTKHRGHRGCSLRETWSGALGWGAGLRGAVMWCLLSVY